MSQMKIVDRNRSEFLVALGWPLPSETNCLDTDSIATRDTDARTESVPTSMNACAKHSPLTEKSCERILPDASNRALTSEKRPACAYPNLLLSAMAARRSGSVR